MALFPWKLFIFCDTTEEDEAVVEEVQNVNE
jgi:hypothetical protein